MTTARDDQPVRELPDVRAYNRRMAAELRGEMAKRKFSQTEVAREVFDKSPQWLQSRISGNVAIDAAELLAIADYIGADILPIMAAAKGGNSPTPFTSRRVTNWDNRTGSGQLLLPYLTVVPGGSDNTPRVLGHLRRVS